MKKGAVLALILFALTATNARADDKSACLEASYTGQRLRRTHKLVEARDPLRACAADQCPAVVRADCATWLEEVEQALPTVVIAVKDAAGADRVNVTVSVDGEPLLSKLDGEAVPMNAGTHTLHAEGEGATSDLEVIVREGQKHQPIVLSLRRAASAEPAPPASNTLKTVGWVLGGAGAVGLGVGAVFGIIAIADKSAADCDQNGACKPNTVASIKRAAFISDVGWVTGGLLLGSGAALVLLAPNRKNPTSVAMGLAPIVTRSGGAFEIRGWW